ncbi:response regulator [Carboxylicivirga linearis]|uniref:Response regulator transcription factor n=1 Tax=Carboxylicivirga linearis TaxID=1628157 RepID=A0ABS5JX16_9BACT|nr:response regulator transcription factor [Carboxylicivirga linearis]MBS2099465.1 response regulator transcription factor [Carboxylicivirga linearis]
MIGERQFNIIIADDHQDFIEGIKVLLLKHKSFKLIGEANSGKELLEHPQLYRADIAIIDINMPDLNGIDVGKQINFISPKVKLVAVSLYNDQVYLNDLISSGFRGFVSKIHIANQLGVVLGKVVQSQFAFPQEIKLTASRK